jgi:hypothetical protein
MPLARLTSTFAGCLGPFDFAQGRLLLDMAGKAPAWIGSSEDDAQKNCALGA